MRTLKAGREANQINGLNMNIFNSLAKCSQFVILTQEATFRPPPPLPTKPLHTNNLHIFNVGGIRFKANNIRSQKKASFSAPSQGHLRSRFPGKFNNPLSHWLSTFINNNNSSFNLKSITKWSTAVRSMVFMVILLTRKATWHNNTLFDRLPPTLQKNFLPTSFMRNIKISYQTTLCSII